MSEDPKMASRWPKPVGGDTVDPTDVWADMALGKEIARQQDERGSAYPATRDGIRLGLSYADDELSEALNEWDRWKKNPDPHQWGELRTELIQCAAVIMRIVKGLDEA